MNQLELQNARELIEKFEELQEEFNNKYEGNLVSIGDNGELDISSGEIFNFKDLKGFKQIIIDYKKIITSKMNQLELQNARELINKFEELQEEFNNKYEKSGDVRIDNDGELDISSGDYFGLEDIDLYEQIIINYKKIISD